MKTPSNCAAIFSSLSTRKRAKWWGSALEGGQENLKTPSKGAGSTTDRLPSKRERIRIWSATFPNRKRPVCGSIRPFLQERLPWATHNWPKTFRYITHPFATRHPRSKLLCAAVRLACVKHAASVQSEPGSNSYVQSLTYNFWSASKKPTGQCLKHHLVCLSNSVRPNALTLIGNLFFKERIELYSTIFKSQLKLSKISTNCVILSASFSSPRQQRRIELYALQQN